MTNDSQEVKMPYELAQVWDEHKGQILARIRRRIGNSHDAEELLNDTFLKAIQYYPGFRGECKLTTWVYIIADRVTSNAFHYFKRRKRDQSDPLDFVYGLASTEPSARAKVELKEFVQDLDFLIDNLSEAHREILDLRLREGLSYGDLSDRLGINIGTVKSRIARARYFLIEEYKKKNEGNDSVVLHNPVEDERYSMPLGVNTKIGED